LLAVRNPATDWCRTFDVMDDSPLFARDGLDTLDDSALVALIVQRNDNALSEAYRRYGPAVTAIAYRVLSDRTLADDITQDVFVWLWQHAERFDASRGKLRTLLLTKSHGKSVDMVRSRNARRAREELDAVDAPRVVDEIDAELMAMTEAEQIRTALTKLRPEERTAVELAYFGGNTYRQVATILGEPEGTIKTRIRSGLRHLHTFLTDTQIVPIQGVVANTPRIANTINQPAQVTSEGKEQS
jgi:RNA polymerase sigma-70 factor, ECF subfamily